MEASSVRGVAHGWRSDYLPYDWGGGCRICSRIGATCTAPSYTIHLSGSGDSLPALILSNSPEECEWCWVMLDTSQRYCVSTTGLAIGAEALVATVLPLSMGEHL